MNKETRGGKMGLTIKSLSVLGVISWQLIGIAVQAQDPSQTKDVGSNLRISDETEAPGAVVLSLHGTCEYSEDGVHFSGLSSKHIFAQGVVVRTGEKSRLDIFFRRIGATVRLQEDTEVKFEKMFRFMTNGAPEMETLLELRRGRIFTVVHSLVAGGTFEIRNGAGCSVVEGAPTGGAGRYIITADGAQVTHQSSLLPLKLIGEKGITVIAPGQKFDTKEGRTLPEDASDSELSLIEFDELRAMSEAASLEPAGGAKAVVAAKQ